jgi:hypothetical protein
LRHQKTNQIRDMNKLVMGAALALSMFAISCNETTTSGEETASVTADNVVKTTEIKFEEERFNFGTITQGEKVKHTFKFKNTGSEELVIVSAKGSCGCTVPEWPKEPIAPGADGEIYVVFNSDGKSGKQVKQVSIVANTEPATSVIALEGDIIAPSPEAPATEEAAQ